MLSKTTTAITAKDGQSAQIIWTEGEEEEGKGRVGKPGGEDGNMEEEGKEGGEER